LFSLILIATDIFGAIPIIRWLLNNDHKIKVKYFIPLLGMALIFLYHSIYSVIELTEAIYFFSVLLILIVSRPTLKLSMLRNVFPIIMFISITYVLLIILGLIDASDVDKYRGSNIYVLRFPFSEPGHFALVIGAIEILLYIYNHKPRILVLLTALSSGSLTSILIVLVIILIFIYRNPLKSVYLFLFSLPFFIFSFIFIYKLYLADLTYQVPILLRIDSVIAGDDVSILRRFTYPLENFSNYELVEKMIGSGYGQGYSIETLLYSNKNFVPNNFYFSVLTQFGILGLIFMLSIYKQGMRYNCFLVTMILIFINGYIFTSVNLFIALLFKSKIIK